MKEIIRKLAAEIRKDFLFFWACGFLVGLMNIWQHKLKVLGVAEGKSWSIELLSDFVSFSSFGFIYLGLLGLGSIATLAKSFGINWQWLEDTVAHVGARLAQFASSIISFTLGLSIFSLIHSLLTATAGGLALACMIVIFNCLLITGFITASLVAHRIAPFNQRWPPTIMLLTSITTVIMFMVYGFK